MNKAYSLCAGCALMMLVSGCGGFGGKIASYSAEQVQLDGAGNVRHSTLLYVTPQKIRVEPASGGREGGMIMIFRRDQKLLRILLPKQQTYVEKTLDENELGQMLRSVKTDAKVQNLGTETVNGFVCHKRQIDSEGSVLGIKTKGSATVWVSDRLEIPVKSADKSGYVTELRNIKPGGQPSSLFEVPKDYTKIDNLFQAVSKSRPPDTEVQGGAAQVEQEARDRAKSKGLHLPFGRSK